MIIILPSVPYQQGSRITVTTYPFCKEHLSFFLVQRAVDPFGSEVNQPWLSCATYSLLFAQSLHSLLLPFGLGFLWKRWTLILLRNLFQTERPGVLWLMGSQRVGHDWATELNWTDALRLYPSFHVMCVCVCVCMCVDTMSGALIKLLQWQMWKIFLKSKTREVIYITCSLYSVLFNKMF